MALKTNYVSKHDISLSAAEFTIVHDNMKMCQTKIEAECLVILDVETEPDKKVSLLAHPLKKSEMKSAKVKLLELIACLTPKVPIVTVRELMCNGEIVNSVFLLSRSKLFNRLKLVADQHSVEVVQVRDMKMLRLSGNEDNVRKVEDTFNSIVSLVNDATECTQLSIAKHHYPILSTDSFKKLLVEMEREIHFVSSHHGTRKLLRQVQLKCQADQSLTVNIIVGTLAGEAVDAIVIPAGTQDPTMTNAEMTEKYAEHIRLHSTNQKIGDVFCLSIGSFPSKMVFHVVLPTDKNFKGYVLSCWSCIQQAISKGLKILSITMLGVDDKHNLSASDCTTILLTCINHLCTQSTSISTITIVMNDENTERFLDSFDRYNFTAEGAAVTKSQPSCSWH